MSCSGRVVEYEGNTTVEEGDPFTITCRLSIFEAVKWEKDGVVLIPDSHNMYQTSEESADGDTKVLARLRVKFALPLHSGTYQCNSFNNKSHHLTVLSGKSVVDFTINFLGFASTQQKLFGSPLYVQLLPVVDIRTSTSVCSI